MQVLDIMSILSGELTWEMPRVAPYRLLYLHRAAHWYMRLLGVAPQTAWSVPAQHATAWSVYALASLKIQFYDSQVIEPV